MTEGRIYYYEGVELYVYSDENGIYKPGAKWNIEVLQPEGVILGRREESFEWIELKGFARTINTIHGLLLELNNFVRFNDKITRDTTTLQGCMNLI